MNEKNSACVFCQIIQHPDNHSIIYEDVDTLCFLDKRPLFLGHSLLIPKSHFESLHDLPSSLVPILFDRLTFIEHAVKTGMQAEGSFIAMNNIVSQSVPHFHIHIVPRTKGDGLKGFFWPRTNYSSEEEKRIVQNKIIQALP